VRSVLIRTTAETVHILLLLLYATPGCWAASFAMVHDCVADAIPLPRLGRNL